jgi:hypothetical protein
MLRGHGGAHTSDYTVLHLPDLIWTVTVLRLHLEESKVVNLQAVAALLRLQIQRFDHQIGNAVKKLCPKPKKVDDATLEALFAGPHAHILHRANSEATLSAVLLEKHFSAVALGDSPSVCWNLFRPNSTVFEL